MLQQRSVKQLWSTRESGLNVPDGFVTDISQYNSQSFLELKKKAIAIEKLYTDNQISLISTSDLFVLISDAKKLGENSFNNNDDFSDSIFFHGIVFNRIANVILQLNNIPQKIDLLKALTSSGVNLFKRKNSYAKNIFWELELWSILKNKSFNAILEEPDIVVEFDKDKIGIACKKIYSEKHVQNVLSQAVKQIEINFDYGIVALNLDDLVPPNEILKSPNYTMALEFISKLNALFLERHERHIRKYLLSGRAMAVLIFTNVVAELYSERVRFNNCFQSTIWTIPGLPPDKEKQLRKFYYQLMK